MTENTRRPLKHRPRERSFRFADYSKPMSKAPKDDRTLNRKGPQVEIVRPKWNGTAPMTFRPLPMTCAEDPELFDPTRLTTDEYDFSDFWRGLPAVKYVGIDQKFTFLAYDPRRAVEENYNPRQDNPYHVLYNAVMDAVKKTGEAIVKGKDVMTGKWSPLVNDGPMKAFNAPTKMYFMQGVIFESDGELYVKGGSPPKGLRDGDLPQIIELSKSAGEKLAQKLNMLNPDYNGDTEVGNQHEMYLYGDLVDIVHGGFVTLFNPKKHHNVSDAFEDFDDDSGDDDGGFQSWGVAINPEFQIIAKRQPVVFTGDLSEHVERIRKALVPWDEILYFPSDEEICRMMAQAFRSMPTLLEFGWADHPEFFTAEVEGILANRVQAQGATVDEEEEAEEAPVARQTPSRPNKQKSAALQHVEDEVEEQEEVEEVAETVEEPPFDETPAKVEDDYEEGDYEEDTEEVVEDEEEAAITAEEEEAALAALERAKMRPAPAKAGPKTPPPTKTGKKPSAKTPVARK